MFSPVQPFEALNIHTLRNFKMVCENWTILKGNLENFMFEPLEIQGMG